MSEAQQLILNFEHRPAHSGDDFLVSDCNRAAINWIDSWPNWPAPALVIVGPPGSGKSHLAAVFKSKSNALQVHPEEFERIASSEDRDLIVEDIDAELSQLIEEPLLHLYNAANENNRRILFTAASSPSRWNIQLPDLRSRLNAALSAEIGPPEDTLIAALLVKMFSDRQVQVTNEVIAYTVNRMERSFLAARQIVEQADQRALSEKKKITVSLMKQVLEEMNFA